MSSRTIVVDALLMLMRNEDLRKQIDGNSERTLKKCSPRVLYLCHKYPRARVAVTTVTATSSLRASFSKLGIEFPSLFYQMTHTFDTIMTQLQFSIKYGLQFCRIGVTDPKGLH